ncbi:YfhO family protein [Thermophagus xiamenensis]|uniref:Membrane protein YfhO n=1 Tax=Thermophagus xiamenensis TaxID=385682 RepID=A0A1I2D1G2_9BACT|nr:YfhO family protein [Thermophagus xiamenensis]SFE74335.1 membrane protein YfhO [Thermophagus xiamenensis]
MNFQKLKPLFNFLGILVFFIVLSFAYFSPVLKGFELPQMDNLHALGMSRELVEYENETGKHAYWTNSMFGGMPAYQIKGDSSANIFSYLNKFFRLGLPFYTVAILFLYLLGFYILLRSVKTNRWLSLLGSIAFAFGSYNIIIIIAGHITKAYAIALMAPVVAGILYTLNKNKWQGALFTTLALGLHIAYNHVQITYYLFILVLILMVSRFIYALKEKNIKDFLSRSAILIGAAILAILPNLPHLLPTYEYGKYSIRGASELKSEAKTDNKPQKGLDRDYAFAWSYGKAETLTLMIPNVMGGASQPLAQNPRAMQAVEPRLKDIVGGQSQYWGSKPFTSGPVYLGALICFFFVLSLFFYHGPEKWWLVAATILSILLAWGKNLEWFNYFMFDHFPLYNKFRTVEMTLVIASVTVPFLGLMGLKKLVDNPAYIREQSGNFLAAFGLTGGVALILYLFPDLFFNFISSEEAKALAQQKKDLPDQAALIDLVIENLRNARMTLLKSDALRSFFFILLGSGSLWLYSTNRVSKKYILLGLTLLVLIDLWAVDKRYLSSKDFVEPRQIENQFQKTPADKFILNDDDICFRVFSIYRNPFTEVNTSYYHKSIGGYHGAKLRLYQDIIDYYLQNDWQMLLGHFRNGGSPEDALDLLADMPVLNMLNTKYVIYNPSQSPLLNIHNFGEAWLVDNLKVVSSAEEEISTLAKVDLKTTAVIRDNRLDNNWKDYNSNNREGFIQLTSYAPDRLVYNAQTTEPKVAVFSEIFYPAGWNAYIDGKKTDIKRVNYLLRAIMVPPGKHVIEFRFEPNSVQWANRLAILGGIAIFVFAIFLIWTYRKQWLGKIE